MAATAAAPITPPRATVIHTRRRRRHRPRHWWFVSRYSPHFGQVAMSDARGDYWTSSRVNDDSPWVGWYRQWVGRRPPFGSAYALITANPGKWTTDYHCPRSVHPVEGSP